jgi:hypothetical protein
LRYTVFAGPAYRFAKIGNVSLWGLGTVGLAADGNYNVADYAGGGFLTFPLGKGWGLLLGAQVDKNAISGTDGIGRIGFVYAK